MKINTQKLSTTTQVALERHLCEYCHYYINPTEEYERAFVIDEEEPREWKSHVSCQRIAEKLSGFKGIDRGFGHDEFYQCIENEYMRLTDARPTEPNLSDLLELVKQKHGIKQK